MRKFFSKLYKYFCQVATDKTLLISIYEFPRPRFTGTFEICLGKVIVFHTPYDFLSTTLDELKSRIDAQGINLTGLKFNKIKYRNISPLAIQGIQDWFEVKDSDGISEAYLAEPTISMDVPSEANALEDAVLELRDLAKRLDSYTLSKYLALKTNILADEIAEFKSSIYDSKLLP
jgi:hypothetical protein